MNLDKKNKTTLLLFVVVLSVYYVTNIIDWVHGTITKFGKWYRDKKEDKRRLTAEESILIKESGGHKIYDMTAVNTGGDKDELPSFDGFDDYDGFDGSDDSYGFASSDNCSPFC